MPSNSMLHSLDYQSSDAINLAIGEPHLSFFDPKHLEVLSHKHNIHHYYPSHGDLELIELLKVRYYSHMNSFNLAITHGAIGALDLIFRSSFSHGSHIILPDPGFPPYEYLARFSGYQIKRYQLSLSDSSGVAYDWDHIEWLVSDKTKLILFNSPHNPTGLLFTASDKLHLIRLLERMPQLHFIMDEVYRELIFGPGGHVEMDDLIGRGYVVGSFSKVFPLQGARIGWLGASKTNLSPISSYLNNAIGAISSFGQELAKSYLRVGTNYLPLYVCAMKKTAGLLEKYGIEFVIPKGAFYFFIKTHRCDLEVTQELAKLGVNVIAGSKFGLGGRGFIRVSFSIPNLNRMEEAIQKISIVIRDTKEKSLLC